ncbi:MAG: GNAT family N-acetyltransferase [Saprospiraceae bacterium]|nr:GNAT family N-acetyltransferase [Saprospiraceae bacterium]MCF8250830.1 GNAT family N-acetyltransferase [Saprospiraceae bacterium]MCF8281445.1 GNAT family N-acetyltransferase [Bacteroidales bacterium]MCF8312631.1 GNAT family N-acetyltransferase [Saprospiraceae bacterium]MCF8441021.1 GNAT family N-acetyltransferase [Saprospiraceae bacterium]
MTITLIKDKEASNLFHSLDFQAEWLRLAEASSGFTVLQQPAFATTWYDIYASDYEPVVVTARADGGGLVAMICLAWNKQHRFLTHAGHRDAEYHGWLAFPEVEVEFLSEVFQLVKKQFPVKKWKWSWLAPGLSAEALRKAGTQGTTVQLETRPAPVWDLTNPEKLEKLRKSRSVKPKFNKYKKRGDFRFELITCKDKTAAALKMAALQCDFRQEAIHNARPFASDPRKIEFCNALQSHSGMVHVSALWLDNQLLAFHFGIIDGKRAYLGIKSYDPSESRQSPGLLLLIELAEVLVQQGFELLDLTPGTDAYKERFANDHQLLSRPTICFSPVAALSATAKNTAIILLNKSLPLFKTDLLTMASWKENIKSWVGKLRHLRPSDFARFLFLKKSMFVYAFEQQTKVAALPAARNYSQSFEDLMLYNESQPFPTRRLLLQDALGKFSDGDKLISSTVDGQLSWFAWLTESQQTVKPRLHPQNIDLGENCVSLYDFYCPDGQHFLENLEQALAIIPIEENNRRYLCLESKHKLPIEKAQELGLVSVKKWTCLRVLYFFKKSRQETFQP